jgi:uncharacterized protein YndB with AHSA1/START domain
MPERTKIHLEYTINCSPKVLFNRLSSASGLAEWFADNVTVRGRIYTFTWARTRQDAEMTVYKENKMVRFTWLGTNEEYFEFKIVQDELTGDVALIVDDFAVSDEIDEAINLWNMQIADLKHIVGSN